MITQNIDGIPFKMKKSHDFGFLSAYGRVFSVFDDQDSGNICFGIDSPEGRLFLKFAGAYTAEYNGDPAEAVKRLKAAAPVYETLRHPLLISLREAIDIGGGYALVFDWADGECMGRMYEASHRRIMSLPAAEKLCIFADIISFMKHTAAKGYTAVDFYDGSIMYDTSAEKTVICDIDFFRKQPAVNDMGRMWGSQRFMSPEEYTMGAALDEVTNVFTLGQMGFSLFTDSDTAPAAFPLSMDCYRVLLKAVSPDRNERYRSIAGFEKDWQNALQTKTKGEHI